VVQVNNVSKNPLISEASRPVIDLNLYPCISDFSRDVGLRSADMIQALHLEREFHKAVLAESSRTERLRLYSDVYTQVFKIYGFNSKLNLEQDVTSKLPIIEMFRRELTGASVMDAGCGTGQFLLACAKNVKPKRLLGIDVFAENAKFDSMNLEFKRADLVEFQVNETFDVVMSDNVVEHLTPVDLITHLQSIHAALKPGGILIVLTPNRLFGPWDVTRIIDYSYSGTTPAQGTHVNEMNHTELIAALKCAGFSKIKSLMPRSSRLRHIRNIRVPATLMAALEKVPPLVKYLQRINKKNSLQAYEIGLVASV
jgi:2-polyprenyl-3-methyl-5-hydroxy-6-metoxy-1,4-benzoquinol methylase